MSLENVNVFGTFTVRKVPQTPQRTLLPGSLEGGPIGLVCVSTVDEKEDPTDTHDHWWRSVTLRTRGAHRPGISWSFGSLSGRTRGPSPVENLGTRRTPVFGKAFNLLTKVRNADSNSGVQHKFFVTPGPYTNHHSPQPGESQGARPKRRRQGPGGVGREGSTYPGDRTVDLRIHTPETNGVFGFWVSTQKSRHYIQKYRPKV